MSKDQTDLINTYQGITAEAWRRVGDILPKDDPAQAWHERLRSLLKVLIDEREKLPLPVSLPPSLNNMVDAIPADAVSGLKPLLRRMAETLGCHHKRMTAIESVAHHHPGRPASIIGRGQRSWQETDAEPNGEQQARYVERTTRPVTIDDDAAADCLAVDPGVIPRVLFQRLYDAAVAVHLTCTDWRGTLPDFPNETVEALLSLDAAREAVEAADPDSKTSDSKSGEPTPAAEEIARLTEECAELKERAEPPKLRAAREVWVRDLSADDRRSLNDRIPMNTAAGMAARAVLTAAFSGTWKART